MNILDFFRRDGGQQSRRTDRGADDSKVIKTAPKPGTLYFLRARNIKSGFDDVLCFDSEIMRRRYVGTARESTPYPDDWYFDEWETTAESRLQDELEKQRAALTDSYKKDIARLEYKIRGLQSDKRNLESRMAGGSYLQRYNNAVYALDVVKRDLAAEKQKTAELIAMIEAVKARKEQDVKAPAQTQSAAAILNALQADIYKVMASHDSAMLDNYAAEYAAELQQIKKRIPLQGRLVLAMINRQIKESV